MIEREQDGAEKKNKNLQKGKRNGRHVSKKFPI